jgi:hypothetical protein
MKKPLLLLTLVLTAMVSFSSSFAQQAAHAKLEPIKNSGVRGMLTFSDDGIALVVHGVASGLDPTQTYATLLYDRRSRPKGGNACLPTDGSMSFTQMLVGVWVVDGDGNATLTSVMTGPAYVALNKVGTASIRRDTNPSAGVPTAPDPKRFVLQACGKVRS